MWVIYEVPTRLHLRKEFIILQVQIVPVARNLLHRHLCPHLIVALLPLQEPENYNLQVDLGQQKDLKKQ